MKPSYGPFTLLKKIFTNKLCGKPTASQVLTAHLTARNSPWTSFFIPYSCIINDHWGWSHFNWSAGGCNYQILRTGCYPYIKYHCSRRSVSDLTFEDKFFKAIKILNLGEFMPVLIVFQYFY